MCDVFSKVPEVLHVLFSLIDRDKYCPIVLLLFLRNTALKMSQRYIMSLNLPEFLHTSLEYLLTQDLYFQSL